MRNSFINATEFNPFSTNIRVINFVNIFLSSYIMNSIKNSNFLPIDISRASPNFKPKLQTIPEYHLTKFERDNIKEEEEDDEEYEENIKKKIAQQHLYKMQAWQKIKALQKQYELEENRWSHSDQQFSDDTLERQQRSIEEQQQQQHKLEDDEQFDIEIGGGIVLTKKKPTNTKKRKQTKGRTKKRKSKRRMTKKRSRRNRP
uniref:Uncharacterized protein n=1 Tax=viral metagenome TaxID=1070528 RepID=A0A6C0EV23_9ZZZZ